MSTEAKSSPAIGIPAVGPKAKNPKQTGKMQAGMLANSTTMMSVMPKLSSKILPNIIPAKKTTRLPGSSGGRDTRTRIIFTHLATN